MLDRYSTIFVWSTSGAVATGVLAFVRPYLANADLHEPYPWLMLAFAIWLVGTIWTALWLYQSVDIVVVFRLLFTENPRPVVHLAVINRSYRRDITIGRICFLDAQGLQHFLSLAPVYLGKEYAAQHPDITRDTRSRGPVKIAASGDAQVFDCLPDSMPLPAENPVPMELWLLTDRGFAKFAFSWSEALREHGFLMHYCAHPEDRPKGRWIVY